MLLGCASGARVERAEHTVLYAALGEVLTWYDANAGDATLVLRGDRKSVV